MREVELDSQPWELDRIAAHSNSGFRDSLCTQARTKVKSPRSKSGLVSLLLDLAKSRLGQLAAKVVVPDELVGLEALNTNLAVEIGS